MMGFSMTTPESRGLSGKAAMVLYTGEVETDVVNRILENPKFPEITRMINCQMTR